MNSRYLNRLLSEEELVAEKVREYLAVKSVHQAPVDKEQVRGHLAKADHNLRFVSDNIKLKYYDWCVTVCYYAMYHAALAMIGHRGYYSKSHDATLCVLIKEHYKKGVSAQEIELINRCFLDTQEIVFYVQAKERRQDASYSTRIIFDRQLVSELRIKAALFVDKAKRIIENTK